MARVITLHVRGNSAFAASRDPRGPSTDAHIRASTDLLISPALTIYRTVSPRARVILSFILATRSYFV